jgi:L-iditol 2-dehydrogenase
VAKTMKAAVIVAKEKVDIMDLPIPEPGPGEILVRQKACALCTVEQRVFKGIINHYPGCWGHETSGIVEKIGPGTTTMLKPGDHVALGAPYFCGECHFCINGKEENCLQSFDMLEIGGIKGIFGMAEYSVVQSKRAFKVAEDIPFTESCLVEPLACVLKNVNMLNVNYGDTAVVIGAGTMGMLNVMALNQRGAKVIVSELSPSRRKKALELGAFAAIDPTSSPVEEQIRAINDGRGADIVVTAIGNDKANQDALKMVEKHGRISFFASAHPGVPLSVDPNFLHRTSVCLTGTTGKNQKDLYQAAQLISSRKINVAALAEAVYPFKETEKALTRAANEETYRIILDI